MSPPRRIVAFLIFENYIFSKKGGYMEREEIAVVEPKELTKNDLILDIRSGAQHEALALDRPHWHVEAVNVRPQDFIASYHLDGTTTLYLICTTGCKAVKMARKFKDSGFENVAVVSGGMRRAQEQGLKMIVNSDMTVPRQVHLAAGILFLSALVLGFAFSPWFYLIGLVVALGLIVSGTTGVCTLTRILDKMPWNA